MKIKITGDRGKTFDKEIIVEVDRVFTCGEGLEWEHERYSVWHTDGKLAFINADGGCYSRMNGCKFITIMTACSVEIVKYDY